MFSKMKLGKRPARHDSRTLKLANYVTSDLVAPERIDWSAKLSDLGMMLNDQYGCCTCSGAGHMIQAWTANNGNQKILSDDDILKAYRDVGHFVPGDPSTDNGAVEIDVLNYWRNTGIGGDKIFAYVALEPKNKEHIKLAVDLLGGCYLGVALPLSAQGQEVWSVPATGLTGGNAPGSWGGHAVCVVSYNPTGLVCISWGILITLTWEFFFACCDEAYGILSTDWAESDRVAPSGFKFDELQKDLNLIAH